MTSAIQKSIQNPPFYRVWGRDFLDRHSRNCTEWASDIWKQAGLPYEFGVTHHWNPYGQAFWLQANRMRDSFITELQTKFGRAEHSRSPLVLDLNGDGVQTLGLGARVQFDHDGNGFAERTGWVSTQDGLLIWDRNNDGQINDGSELFGNHSPAGASGPAENGFAALSQLDDNQDGQVDEQDAAFRNLRVWRDLNSDGQLQAAELQALRTADVASLQVGHVLSSRVDHNGNAHRQVGAFTRSDGSAGEMTDIWFAIDGVRTEERKLLPVSAAVAALPDLPCMSNVPSLHQAMMREDGQALRALIEAFVREQDPAARRHLVAGIVFRWTGVHERDPESFATDVNHWLEFSSGEEVYRDGKYNFAGDARKLFALEALLDREFRSEGESRSAPLNSQLSRELIGPGAAARIDAAFRSVENYVYGQLVLQTDLLPMLQEIRFSVDANGMRVDMSSFVSALSDIWQGSPVQATSTLHDYLASLEYAGEQGRVIREALDRHGQSIGGAFGDLLSAGVTQLHPDAEVTITSPGGDFSGTDGEDTLRGDSRRNVLDGGAGDDCLEGGDGDDVLIGGRGNDVLKGGRGDDAYLFSTGDGVDTIVNYDSVKIRSDLIRFTDVRSDELRAVRRENRDILIDYGVDDCIRIQNQLHRSAYQIDGIVFSDGVRWHASVLSQMT